PALGGVDQVVIDVAADAVADIAVEENSAAGVGSLAEVRPDDIAVNIDVVHHGIARGTVNVNTVVMEVIGRLIPGAPVIKLVAEDVHAAERGAGDTVGDADVPIATLDDVRTDDPVGGGARRAVSEPDAVLVIDDHVIGNDDVLGIVEAGDADAIAAVSGAGAVDRAGEEVRHPQILDVDVADCGAGIHARRAAGIRLADTVCGVLQIALVLAVDDQV